MENVKALQNFDEVYTALSTDNSKLNATIVLNLIPQFESQKNQV